MNRQEVGDLLDTEYERIKADALDAGISIHLPTSIPASIRGLMLFSIQREIDSGTDPQYAIVSEVETYEEACWSAFAREGSRQ